MFKIHDVFGIVAAMLSLVLVYLFLKNSSGAKSLLSAGGSVVNNTLSTLQGR